MSNQLLLRRRAMMVGGDNRPNYLRFTAQEDNCTIALDKVGTPYDHPTEYALNKGMFLPYTYGDTINLDNGETVEWRRAEGYAGNSFSYNDSHYYSFVTTGSIIVNGIITSLIDSNIETTELESNCFSGLLPANEGLVSNFTLPSSLTKIGSKALYDCKSFQGNIIIPNNVNWIGSTNFNLPKLIDIIIPSSVTTINNYIFQGGGGIGTLYYNANTQKLPDWFSGTANFKKAIFSSPLSIIGQSSMRSMVYLNYVDLPNTITEIQDAAFYADFALRTFIIRATTPPIKTSNAIPTTVGALKIYVPNGCAATYESDSNWSAFTGKIYELDENGEIPS